MMNEHSRSSASSRGRGSQLHDQPPISEQRLRYIRLASRFLPEDTLGLNANGSASARAEAGARALRLSYFLRTISTCTTLLLILKYICLKVDRVNSPPRFFKVSLMASSTCSGWWCSSNNLEVIKISSRAIPEFLMPSPTSASLP